MKLVIKNNIQAKVSSLIKNPRTNINFDAIINVKKR